MKAKFKFFRTDYDWQRRFFFLTVTIGYSFISLILCYLLRNFLDERSNYGALKKDFLLTMYYLRTQGLHVIDLEKVYALITKVDT